MDIKTNAEYWNSVYDWKNGGDEWSSSWGDTNMEWFGTILPRIHPFLPSQTILEIAPGFGRWTQYLAPLCKSLVVVDLTEQCIQACRRKFTMHSHIVYHVNDGRSLDMIRDDSIDFVFSFDSLVHAETDAIESYLLHLAKKLKRNGAAFIHHSNLGEYETYFRMMNKLPERLRMYLAKLGMVEGTEHGRAFSMTAAKFRHYAEQSGLRVLSQELVNWGTKRLIDSFSVFTRADSDLQGGSIPRRNDKFGNEMDYLRGLSELYSRPQSSRSGILPALEAGTSLTPKGLR